MKINIGACKKRKFRGNIEDIMDILVLGYRGGLLGTEITETG